MSGARLARRAALAAVAMLPALAGAPAAAQQVRTVLLPDTATVGDVVSAVVRITLPPGFQVAVPDSLPVSDTLENAGRRGLSEETLPSGEKELTVVYPLTPWRPGDLTIPLIPLRIVGPGVDRQLTARLVTLHVRSVLPADTALRVPKPPKDVVGPNRLLWPYILAAILALLLLLALLYWLWRHLRRRVVVVAPEEVLTARERALRELDRVRAAGLLETDEVKAFYSRSTDAVRGYLDALDPTWGADRTTSELIPRVRTLDLKVAAALARLLDRADLVKFARFRPAAPEAQTDWAELRRWVEAFPEPEPVEAELEWEEARAA